MQQLTKYGNTSSWKPTLKESFQVAFPWTLQCHLSPCVYCNDSAHEESTAPAIQPCTSYRLPSMRVPTSSRTSSSFCEESLKSYTTPSPWDAASWVKSVRKLIRISKQVVLVLNTGFPLESVTEGLTHWHSTIICVRIWEKGPLRADLQFPLRAQIVAHTHIL